MVIAGSILTTYTFWNVKSPTALKRALVRDFQDRAFAGKLGTSFRTLKNLERGTKMPQN